MSSRVPDHAEHSEDCLSWARPRRGAALGPVGRSMIDLIGASLLVPEASAHLPHPAIWAKL